MMQKSLSVLIPCILLVAALFGFTVTHQAAILVSGTTTGPGSIWVQIRDASGGMECQTTDECILAASMDATQVRDCIGQGWDRDPPACNPSCAPCANNIDCVSEGPDVIRIFTDAAFTCWASSDSVSWTEISETSSFTTVNVTVSLAADPAPIPSLTEWGLILLAALVVVTGALVLRKRRLGVAG